MTNTTSTTTATWTRNLEASDASYLGDDNYGTYRGGRSYFYNVRGTNGRFAKVAHIDQLELDAAFVTDGRGWDHSHTGCTKFVGEVTNTGTQNGWACSLCVHVPESTFDLADTVATKSGKAECGHCGNVQSVTKFPTVHVGGVVTRGGTCRSCQAETVAANKAKKSGPVGGWSF